MCVRLTTLDLESSWFAATRRKEAEHAAAEGLLRLLPDFDDSAESEQTVNPRSALNELVQQGRLAECDGPRAALRPSVARRSRRHRRLGAPSVTTPASGGTKREAVHKAATELLRPVFVELG